MRRNLVKAASGALYVDGQKVAEGRIPKTHLMPFRQMKAPT